MESAVTRQPDELSMLYELNIWLKRIERTLRLLMKSRPARDVGLMLKPQKSPLFAG